MLTKGLFARKNLRVRRFGVQFLTLELSRFSALLEPFGSCWADRRLSPSPKPVKRFRALLSRCVRDKRKLISRESNSLPELESMNRIARDCPKNQIKSAIRRPRSRCAKRLLSYGQLLTTGILPSLRKALRLPATLLPWVSKIVSLISVAPITVGVGTTTTARG